MSLIFRRQFGPENVFCCRDRPDGAAGVYAPMNDINLEQVWALQEAVEGKANSGDHQRGYGGLNNFPCGAQLYKSETCDRQFAFQ